MPDAATNGFGSGADASLAATGSGEGPTLYRPRRGRPVVPAGTRIVALGVAAGCLAVLLVGAWLRPSHTGMGSHRELGLRECSFLERTGLPCPSCGMTTSFTWFAHGNLLASFYVQPMGMLLAAAAAGCVWGGAYIAVTGRPAHRLLSMYATRGFWIGALTFAALAWGWKIFLHLRGLDGWG